MVVLKKVVIDEIGIYEVVPVNIKEGSKLF